MRIQVWVQIVERTREGKRERKKWDKERRGTEKKRV